MFLYAVLIGLVVFIFLLIQFTSLVRNTTTAESAKVCFHFISSSSISSHKPTTSFVLSLLFYLSLTLPRFSSIHFAAEQRRQSVSSNSTTNTTRQSTATSLHLPTSLHSHPLRKLNSRLIWLSLSARDIPMASGTTSVKSSIHPPSVQSHMNLQPPFLLYQTDSLTAHYSKLLLTVKNLNAHQLLTSANNQQHTRKLL